MPHSCSSFVAASTTMDKDRQALTHPSLTMTHLQAMASTGNPPCHHQPPPTDIACSGPLTNHGSFCRLHLHHVATDPYPPTSPAVAQLRTTVATGACAHATSPLPPTDIACGAQSSSIYVHRPQPSVLPPLLPSLHRPTQQMSSLRRPSTLWGLIHARITRTWSTHPFHTGPGFHHSGRA